MTTIPAADRSLNCSCLKAYCDLFNPRLEDVMERLNAAFPDMDAQSIPWEDFKSRYLKVTNQMAFESEYFQSLPEAEQQRLRHKLETQRCGMCGIRVLRYLDKENAVSMFDVLRKARKAPATTLCVDGIPIAVGA